MMVRRRLFAGMENAKISRCCWTIHFTPSTELKLSSLYVCVRALGGIMVVEVLEKISSLFTAGTVTQLK